MMQDLEVIYTAGSLEEAHFVRNLLEERGIRAMVTNVEQRGGSPLVLWGREWTSLPRVAVKAENAAAARQIALEFDRSLKARHEPAGQVAAAEPAPGEIAMPSETAVQPATLTESWPRCPQCGAPRITKCPACGTSGTGFPPADVQPDPPPLRPLLLCLECDEPFEPEYARNCEWCGHEFPDGFRPPERARVDSISPALMAVVAVAVLIVAGLLAYFAILLHNAGS